MGGLLLWQKKKTFRFNRIKIFVLIGVLVYASLTFLISRRFLRPRYHGRKSLTQSRKSSKRKLIITKTSWIISALMNISKSRARERLGWLKPGDKKYVEQENSSPSPDPQASDEPSAGE